eukprot:RCo039919
MAAIDVGGGNPTIVGLLQQLVGGQQKLQEQLLQNHRNLEDRVEELTTAVHQLATRGVPPPPATPYSGGPGRASTLVLPLRFTPAPLAGITSRTCPLGLNP